MPLAFHIITRAANHFDRTIFGSFFEVRVNLACQIKISKNYYSVAEFVSFISSISSASTEINTY